jgi:hypothetical protein
MPRLPLTLVALLGLAASPALAVTAQFGVGAQYDTTHVYVAPGDVDAFVKSFLATFGGASTKQVTATVTPTPSSTTSQLLRTPVGAVSLFGFKTPIPYPFGKVGRRRHHRCAFPGSDRPRRRHPVAGRRQHAALLAHDGGQLSGFDDDPGKPDLCLG